MNARALWRSWRTHLRNQAEIRMESGKNSRRAPFLARALPKGGVGCEVGVWKGFFTRTLVEVTEPTRLHLIDPWYVFGPNWTWGHGDRSTTRGLAGLINTYGPELAAGRLVLHIDDDLKVLPTFPDAYFDWAYLDSSHLYEHTLKELELLARKVKPDGVIAGDDWLPDPNDVNHGVYVALNEFVAAGPWRLVYTSEEDQQWALRRGGANFSGSDQVARAQ